MTMRRFLVAVTICVAVASHQHAYAWHGKGHMAVAFVAYRLLTPSIRTRVDALLTTNPSIAVWRDRIASVSADKKKQTIFMLAAAWPDDIKNDPAYTDTNDTVDGSRAARNIGYKDKLRHKYWHFVDRPFSDDGTSLISVPAVNAEERITLFRQTLASSAGDNVKSYDLVWLEHLVGDVHQPLHCATRVSAGVKSGDRGGNGVRLAAGCPECGDATELHGFWDGVVGETNRATIAATFAQTLSAADATAGGVVDVERWITDSFDLARAKVYVNPPIGLGSGPFAITPGYRSEALDVAMKQIALAGARLANLINSNLK
jgi:hypothetical protein